MSPLEPQEMLFMGLGTSAVLWYRIALPALHLGADWVGVQGQPPGPQVLTGLVRGDTRLPRYDDYRVIVLQQVYGRAWLGQIQALRHRGIKVLYEVDDYLHAVAKQPHHDYGKYFTKARLAQHEMCMRACDGIIVSTEYIGRRYARFNRNIYVCRNGIDLARYQLTRPERSTINVGWAGGTGHMRTLVPWLNAVIEVMREHPHVNFVSIGEPGAAQGVGEILGPERALGVPFCAIECYPAAMCCFDIALAPAGQTAWYRGKSDLRWLEASALGIPTIADPIIYPEIRHGETGFHAVTHTQVCDALRWLIAAMPHDRQRVGQAARAHVIRERSSADAAMQWSEVCAAVVGDYESMHKLPRAA